MTQTILQSVKLNIRMSSNEFDNDLLELIDACKIDIQNGNVNVVDDSDPLIRQAIKLYCRANFTNGEIPDRELAQERYDKLKSDMGLSSAYNGNGGTE